MLSLFDGKVCVKCGQWKPFERYSPSPNTKDRLKGLCKECNAAEAREWHKNNRERHKASCKARYQANPDPYKEKARNWRENNREAHNAQTRAWSKANLDKMRVWHRRWYHNNRMKAIWLVRKRQLRLLSNGGDFTDQEWQAMCKQCDNQCLCCGEVKPLTVDHIGPIFYGGRHEASNIQPLCQACNSSKGTRTIDYRKSVEWF